MSLAHYTVSQFLNEKYFLKIEKNVVKRGNSVLLYLIMSWMAGGDGRPLARDTWEAIVNSLGCGFK